jgi:hypothetical protein
LKDKIIELESNSKNKNSRDLYRGINELNTCYQPRTKLVKDDRGDLLADPPKILNRWKNYFCQLLNVYGACGVRQTEIRTAEQFLPQSRASNLRLLLGTWKVINIQVWVRFQVNQFRQEVKHCVRRFISLLSCSGTKKNCLTSGKSQLWYLFTIG